MHRFPVPAESYSDRRVDTRWAITEAKLIAGNPLDQSTPSHISLAVATHFLATHLTPAAIEGLILDQIEFNAKLDQPTSQNLAKDFSNLKIPPS